MNAGFISYRGKTDRFTNRWTAAPAETAQRALTMPEAEDHGEAPTGFHAITRQWYLPLGSSIEKIRTVGTL